MTEYPEVNFSTPEDTIPDDLFGKFIPARNYIEHTAVEIEKFVGGINQDAIQIIAALSRQQVELTERQVPYIPGSVTAAYRLTEYFISSEGDIWQTIELPYEMSSTKLRIRGKDKTARDEIENLFDPDVIDMRQILLDMFLTISTYGCAYPFQIWQGSEPLHLSLLNPRYCAVGNVAGFGERPIWLSSNLGFDEASPTLPRQIKNALQHKGEGQGGEMMFRLDPETVTQVRDKAFPWQPYPLPPLTRCFRSASTRQTLEELIRATVEGYKSQFWVFKLGDTQHPPKPSELAKLVRAISGQAGDRTGYLVWGGNLTVEQHVPKPLDQLLGNERWTELTKHIMRQLGISLRLIDGEVKQADNAPSPVDIKVFIERLKYRRGKVEEFANKFIREYFKRNSRDFSKKDKVLPYVMFADISIEAEERMKNILTPMMATGKLSTHTYIEEAGISDYDTELAYKKAEKKDQEYWMPQPTFSQATVNPNTPEKKITEGTPGRPVDDGTKEPAKEPE